MPTRTKNRIAASTAAAIVPAEMVLLLDELVGPLHGIRISSSLFCFRNDIRCAVSEGSDVYTTYLQSKGAIFLVNHRNLM